MLESMEVEPEWEDAPMYVDGFVLPVKAAHKDDYLAMARKAIALFREHGATRCVETWSDDVPYGEVTSFPRAVQLEDDETAVFSWMEWPDKETRDAAHEKVMADPRMAELMDNGLIAGKRMIYGGFTVIADE